jgi:adenosylcobinamide-phosphate synthase
MRTAIIYSGLAMLTGFVVDTALGDPHAFPHIVRWMGSLILALEKKLYRFGAAGGALLVCFVALVCWGVPFAVLFLCYRFLPALGYVLESFLCWQLLAAKSLKDESMKVHERLLEGDIGAAREAVSMIVGRDTATLDEEGVVRAAVETVAENASDGVAAPIIYIMLGGASLGCLYKAVNTMDSMIGYKNEKYLSFGRAAAKTDDVFNFLPSRICALLMIVSAFLLRCDGKQAWRIWRRDRKNHASPNSAQTEAACAGALGVRLAGPAAYFGKRVEKPYIGVETRPIRADDIAMANRLMYGASILSLLLAIIFRLGVFLITAV